uniref:WAT1-related protein At3g02690, chloroplastic isoform X2 n=1 Tax=Fragaria vesca subsp. vesca TaxID=101020 RepID=UPI0005CB49CC|nr:PREDICTED: WAT1-related protein At3g02690, chloroplastic isoform X2 [Fragaria vesca subsp. vesca]
MAWLSSTSVSGCGCHYNPGTVRRPRCLVNDIRKRNSSSSWTALSYSNCLALFQYNHIRKPIHFGANCTASGGNETTELKDSSDMVDCVGTGQDVECVVTAQGEEDRGLELELVEQLQEWAVLVSPFFFWGTAMVAMKGILPKTGPFFISAFRLIPAGFLLIAFAAYRGRPFPSGLTAWLSIALFGLVDAACFQGFLAQGLQRTSAGLGSVIIDSQPLTVAVLAALFFGESIGFLGAAGLVLGVIGLLLLEAPSLAFDGSNFSLWQNGEWWMLLSAQSMAVGTVMVRWVSKYSDPIMATGWGNMKVRGDLWIRVIANTQVNVERAAVHVDLEALSPFDEEYKKKTFRIHPRPRK